MYVATTANTHVGRFMYVATTANTHVGRFVYVATTANTHGVYKSFDCNPPFDVRGTFRDILKAD